MRQASSRWREWGLPLLVAVPAAVPGALHAIGGAGRYVDDWPFIAAAQLGGPISSGAEWSARPGQALVHTVQFGLLGAHDELLVLVLAMANVVASVLLVRLLKDQGERVALAIGLVLSVLPNRGATFLWASTLPNVVSLCLVLAMARFSGWRRGLVLGAAALTYEGCIGLGLGLAVWLAAREVSGIREIPRALVRPVVPAVAALAYASLSTQSAETRPFSGAARVAASHFGAGVWPRPLVWLGFVLIAALAASVGRLILPGFRAARPEALVVAGFVATVLGVVPFVAVGFPMATDGMLDRANLFGDVGLAVMIVGAVSLFTRAMPSLQTGIVALVAVVLALGTASDLRDARQAQRDGDELLAFFRSCHGQLTAAEPLLVQPITNRGGWGAFAEDYDISAAFRLNDPLHRTWSARTFATEEDFRASAKTSGARTLVHRGPRAGCR